MAEALVTKLLLNPNIKIRDLKSVVSKLNFMIEDGYDKLLVISDFDHTLSCHLSEGKRVLTSHGVFESVKNTERFGFTEDKIINLVEIRDKYLKIEFCPVMSVEEKIPYMIEWWNSTHNKIINLNLSKEEIKTITLESKIILRKNVFDFIHKIEKFGAPLIIFSAGIGDIIEFVIEDSIGPIPKCVHIVSNMIRYENERCVAFSEPIIHTFNKNSSVIQKDAPFYNEINGRTSVLLLGDSLGDIHMDLGVEQENNVLRVGFLNFNVDRLFEKYSKEYDIVVIDDPTFDVPIAIVESLNNNSQKCVH